MCRFVFYHGAPIRLGELLTEPDHSLINQSFSSREREEPLNGDVGGFDAIRRPLLSRLSDEAFDGIEGRTDSEHLLALVQDAIGDGDPSPVVLLDALRRTIDSVRELGATFAPHESLFLNAVLTDGDSAVVCRYTDDDPQRAESLYLNRGRRFVCEGGLCRMIDPDPNGATLLVASEPLSTDPGWERIAPNSALLVQDGQVVDQVAL